MADAVQKGLFSLVIFNCKSTPPVALYRAEELGQFSFWTRGTIREFLIFASREVAGRTNLGERNCIRHSPKDMDMEFHTHCYVNSEGLGSVVLTGGQYNQRVAFTLVAKALEELKKLGAESFLKYTTDTSLTLDTVAALFKKFQVPEEADSITKIEKDLAETREVLIQNVEKLLVRGERLEELMEKSQDLSFQSKAFAKQAKSLNSCCTIL
jgi:synaptobrevin family protein YKT6